MKKKNFDEKLSLLICQIYIQNPKFSRKLNSNFLQFFVTKYFEKVKNKVFFTKKL